MSALRDRLAAALKTSMRARDAVAVSALRSALAALDNAGAVDTRAVDTRAVDTRAASGTGVDADSAEARLVATHPRLAGTAVGAGAAEVDRRELTDDEERALVRAEIDERLAAAGQADLGGRPEHGLRLRREAEVLAEQLAT